MATPHVAGAAALYESVNPNAAPATVAAAITGNATPGVVGNPGTGSPNRLLFTNPAGAPTPTPTPTVTPTPTTTPACAPSFSGSLGQTGAWWNGPECTATSTYTHTGVLRGPANADFDLYLQKRNGSTWQDVARGLSYSANENVSYTGTAGVYRWRVYAYGGSGGFTLDIT
jgi:subtilisin family serine protease